jgi:predicted outer membrane protein
MNFYKMPVSLLVMTTLCLSSLAQVIDPQKSAQAAMASDNRFIAANIADNQTFIFMAQKAKDRASDERLLELSTHMLEDHTSMLYSMEQLATAGNGSSTNTVAPQYGNDQLGALDAKISAISGAGFDTLWVAAVLPMVQKKFDELTQAKETVTNIRLKQAVTEAIPLVRKNLNQLKSIQKYLIRMAIQKQKEEKASRRGAQ